MSLRFWFKLSTSLFVCLLGFFCFYYGRNIPFKEQVVIFDALRNTSAIIFGVMGAWIAIIYPGALTKIFDKRLIIGKDSEIARVKKLVTPMVYSTLIIAVVLVAGLLGPIVKQIPFFISNFKIIRGISYSTLGVLSFLQLVALCLTLLPAEIVKNDLERGRARVERRLRLHSRTQKKEKP